MKHGTFTADGLTAEFIYIRPHANTPGLHRIRTAAGDVWAWDCQLTFR